jgi:hypothetical protein
MASWQRTLLRIAPERRNILLYPMEGEALVKHANVKQSKLRHLPPVEKAK